MSKIISGAELFNYSSINIPLGEINIYNPELDSITLEYLETIKKQNVSAAEIFKQGILNKILNSNIDNFNPYRLSFNSFLYSDSLAAFFTRSENSKSALVVAEGKIQKYILNVYDVEEKDIYSGLENTISFVVKSNNV